MKLLPRLIILFAICLLLIPIAIAPVKAAVGDPPFIRLTPEEGYVGDNITVYGENFNYDDRVDIYYEGALKASTKVLFGTCQHHGHFELTFTIPEGCQGYHEVYAEDEHDNHASKPFLIKPKISLDRSLAHVGESITIKGTGFPSKRTGINIRYYLDADSYTDFPITTQVDDNGSWEESFPIPASAKGVHTIDAYYNDDENTLSRVNNEEAIIEVQPTIILNPDSGCVGDTISISGSGFGKNESNIKLRYDGERIGEQDADENGTWGPISFTIPAGIKGPHLVEAFRGAVIASAIFDLGSGIFLNPAEGHVGQAFNVTGGVFDPLDWVEISYQNETVPVKTDASGNLPTTTFIARGKHGEQYVNASSSGSSVRSAIFYMEDDAPGKPELSSPIDTRTGFFGSFLGRICPRFKWSNVSDASGIASYDLQISRSTDFTTPIVSLSIEGENLSLADDTVAYTLPGEYALSYSSYHWRVKAIDAAENEGDWSEAQSFHAGWLPQWAMIASAAGLLLLIIIISLAIRRRTRYYY